MVVAGPFSLRYTAVMRAPHLLRAAVLLLALCSGCGDDEGDFAVGLDGPLVGGPCYDELDCFSGGICPGGATLRDGDYPGGTCTVPCRGHEDCPPSTACIEDHGGICLLQCIDRLDCRGGYTCKERDDRGDPGKSRVCTK